MILSPLAALADVRRRARADAADPPRRWLRRHWLGLPLLAIAIGAVFALDGWLATCGFGRCPAPAEIRAFRPAEGGRILDRQGRMVGRLTSVRRVNVPIASVPAHVREAFIAVEDRRFYRHDGLDWRGVARAVARNTAALGVREGFSTITMQVARNTFVARYFSERSLRRKLMELRVARLIEGSLSKDQILELYMNVIYLGNGVYGVEAASRDLFGKSIDKVTLAEGAMLAALPKGPSAYTPRRDPQRALRRRNLVLRLMEQERYVSAARAQDAARQPLIVTKEGWHPPQPDDSYAVDAVRRMVDSLLGPRAKEIGDAVVYTTLDVTAQRAADRAIRRRADIVSRQAGGDVQGALVALDPRTGDVRAIVGGRRYERGRFNRAFAARRQPGSAFKPFVFAAALGAGLTPASMVDDEPVVVQQDGQRWEPANYDDEYLGRVTLRRALERSANAATVRVSRAVGEARVARVAHDAGIASRFDPVPAIALGALEVTPLELVTAYATFANGGLRVTPRLVRRVEAADGTLLWSGESVAPVRAMDPVVAYQLTSMLRAVVDHGTGHAVRDYGVKGPVAGKTGTTNNGADVWFVGYTPTLVAGVWFGYDTPKSLGSAASGGGTAAPAWAEFYGAGWREVGNGEAAWAPPPGLEMRIIDAVTGELAGEWCPITQPEWFRPGTAPVTPCREHEALAPTPDGPGEWIENIGEKVSDAFKRVFRF